MNELHTFLFSPFIVQTALTKYTQQTFLGLDYLFSNCHIHVSIMHIDINISFIMQR